MTKEINAKSLKLVEMLDHAIEIAKKMEKEKPLLAKSYGRAISNFTTLKETILSGRLGPSNGAILGLSKGIGEFDEADLYEVGAAMDEFYQREMR